MSALKASRGTRKPQLKLQHAVIRDVNNPAGTRATKAELALDLH
jgi:hypothetical protein